MRVLPFANRDEFARRVTPFLMEREAENCFFLGALSATGVGVPPDVLRIVTENVLGNVTAVGMKWPARHLMMTDAPPAAVDALVDFFVDGNIPLQGVQSRRHVAARFAERYVARSGARARHHSAQAVHALKRVRPVADVPGFLRHARAEDLELFNGWLDAFCTDCGLPQHPPDQQLLRSRQHIERGEAFFWEVDDRPASTASAWGTTPHGIRISLVYTPPHLRGRGYASACVAALSQRLLDSGRKFCFLYTDLANPTSNRIYRAIGYEPVCEDEQIFFEAPPDAAAPASDAT
jgi:predicted GNAT family acetyltransferase